MAGLFLLTGNKKYSSWSLRPWIVMKQAGLKFDEQFVALQQPNTKANILKYSPSGKVPFLRHGKIEVWESLAICEYLAEAFPKKGLWPRDKGARAQARAVSNEMHGGFADLRRYLPMDVSRTIDDPSRAQAVKGEIDRIAALWAQCRRKYGKGGAFLFGKFSIADGMFAPVVTRFATYGVKLPPVAAAYVKTMMALPAMKEWIAAAKEEPWVINYPDPAKG
jgi:glutathione S-transferase